MNEALIAKMFLFNRLRTLYTIQRLIVLNNTLHFIGYTYDDVCNITFKSFFLNGMMIRRNIMNYVKDTRFLDKVHEIDGGYEVYEDTYDEEGRLIHCNDESTRFKYFPNTDIIREIDNNVFYHSPVVLDIDGSVIKHGNNKFYYTYVNGQKRLSTIINNGNDINALPLCESFYYDTKLKLITKNYNGGITRNKVLYHERF